MTQQYLKYDVYQIKMDHHLEQFIDTSQFKHHSGNETEGPCPICGGDKRFHIILGSVHGDQWFCRHCTGARYRGDIFNFLEKLWGASFPEICERLTGGAIPLITPEAAIIKRLEALEKSDAEQKIKTAEIERKLEDLIRLAPWKDYQAHLAKDEHRAKWWARGVPDSYLSYWHLGYDPNFRYWYDDVEYHSPTLTIPLFNLGWELMGIQHRLLKPINPGDKYRPEKGGIPAAPFIANPDGNLTGKTMVVEGAIKSMVVYSKMDDEKLQVVGMPGMNPKPEMVQKFLGAAEPIYICLDPDALPQAQQMARDLGRERCRIVEVPAKVDDLMLRYDLGREWMEKLMRTGARVD